MANLKVSEQAYPTTRYTEAAAPATPASGEVVIYAKADGLLYSKDDAGVETVVTGGGAAGAVATDAIWDAAGDIVVGTGANTAAKLAAGTNGHVLTLAAGTPAWQAPAAGALVLLEQHTASASASLDYTAFISSTYDEYIFEGVNIAPATTAQALRIQVGSGGGPTYDTGSNYAYSIFGLGTSNGNPNSTSGATTFMVVAGAVSSTAAFGNCSFYMRMFNPQSTSVMKQFRGESLYHNGTEVMVTNFGGLWTATATVMTAVKFYFASGNIASGTIRVYGIAK